MFLLCTFLTPVKYLNFKRNVPHKITLLGTCYTYMKNKQIYVRAFSTIDNVKLIYIGT